MNKEIRYKRLECYYDVTRVNGLYSAIMIDIIVIVVPLLMITHCIKLLELSNERVVYISILLSMLTIGFNFIAHLLSIQAHHIHNTWTEKEMGVLNEVEEVNTIGNATGYDVSIKVFSYSSYVMFLASVVAFYMSL